MVSIATDLLFAFWFFAPAGVANVVPILVTRVPYLQHWITPIDFGHTIGEHRIFGDHKTWRGLITGVVAAVLVCIVQFWIADHAALAFLATRPEYDQAQPMLLGFLLGYGALFGDAIESFFKRRVGITAGNAWFPFDQLDYIVGALVFTWWLVPVGVMEATALMVVWFVMHLVFSYLGFRTGFKKKPI